MLDEALVEKTKRYYNSLLISKKITFALCDPKTGYMREFAVKGEKTARRRSIKNSSELQRDLDYFKVYGSDQKLYMSVANYSTLPTITNIVDRRNKDKWWREADKNFIGCDVVIDIDRPGGFFAAQEDSARVFDFLSGKGFPTELIFSGSKGFHIVSQMKNFGFTLFPDELGIIGKIITEETGVVVDATTLKARALRKIPWSVVTRNLALPTKRIMIKKTPMSVYNINNFSELRLSKISSEASPKNLDKLKTWLSEIVQDETMTPSDIKKESEE